MSGHAQGGPVFVLSSVLRNVHGRLIESYGGLPGLRDENALESAVARPKQLVHYTDEQSVAVLGAALPWSLLRNHAFNDGNKRIAFAALVLFLERNDHRLTCAEVEETAMILRASAHDITEDEWIAWVKRVAAPKKIQR